MLVLPAEPSYAGATLECGHGNELPPRTLAQGDERLIADRDGHIGWTVYGSIPHRVGTAGRLPSSWAEGTNGWDGWLGDHRLFAADRLPLWVQIVGGFFLIELGIYAWHRTMHNVTFLWRWFHQMHHSAERVDIWGALYFHPFDSIGWALVGSLTLVLGFGVSAEAAIAIGLITTFFGLFQHVNIQTPQWIDCASSTPPQLTGNPMAACSAAC